MALDFQRGESVRERDTARSGQVFTTQVQVPVEVAAELREEREKRATQARSDLIAHFEGDADPAATMQALTGEILRVRHAMSQIAELIMQATEGHAVLGAPIQCRRRWRPRPDRKGEIRRLARLSVLALVLEGHLELWCGRLASKSLRDLRGSMAAAAAFSHDSVLVPTSSITL